MRWIIVIFLFAFIDCFGQQVYSVDRNTDGGQLYRLSGDRYYQKIPVPTAYLTFFTDYIIQRSSDSLVFNEITGDYDSNVKLLGTAIDGCLLDNSSDRIVFYGDTVSIRALSSNYNRADTLYFKKSDYQLNLAGYLLKGKSLTEIAYYSTSKTGADSITLASYFNVPKYPTSPQVVNSGDLISDAITAASTGDTIIVKSGDYGEYIYITKGVTIWAVGDVTFEWDASYTFDINSSNNVIVKNIDFSSGNTYVIRVRGTGSHSFEGCDFNATTNWLSATSNAGNTYSFTNCYITGGSYIQDNVNISDSYFASGANSHIAAGWERTINSSRNRFFGSSYAVRGYSNFTYNSENNYYGTSLLSTTSMADDTRYIVNMERDSVVKSSTISLSFSKGGKAYLDSCIFYQSDADNSNILSCVNMDTVSITNSYFYDLAGDIYFQASDTTFDANWSNNTIYSDADNACDFLSQQVGFDFIDSYLSGESGFRVVVSNTFSDTIPFNMLRNEFHYQTGTGIAIQYGAVGTPQKLDNSKFYDNLYYGPFYYGNDIEIHGLLVGDVQNMDIARNNLIGLPLGVVVKSGGESMKGTDIRLNRFENCKRGIIVRGCTGISVLGNTSYSDTITDGYNLVLQTHETAYPGTTDTTTVKNNIFYNELGLNISCDSVDNLNESVLDYNLYYNSGNLANVQGINYTFITWKSTFSQDANSYESDPNFYSSTQLWPVTPTDADGNGVDLGTDYEDILLKTSVWPDNVNTDTQDALWDIGAYKIE